MTDEIEYDVTVPTSVWCQLPNDAGWVYQDSGANATVKIAASGEIRFNSDRPTQWRYLRERE